MQSGQKLIAEINAAKVEKGAGAFWWLGQHGFVVKLADKIIYLDPFLSSHAGRQVPPLIKPEEIINADIVLGTHDHADHIDRPAWPAIARASPGARFVVPELLLPRLAAELKIPEDRFYGLNDGSSIEINGVRISGIAAAHEFLDRDPATGRYPYLGYVVERNGFVIYHAGDTCSYEGLQTKLRRWKPDLTFLPINGRDARRLAANCIGNLTYQEAADLAGALAPGVTVPAHYDMFKDNGEDPRLFADYMRVKYPALKVIICKHGKKIAVQGQSATRLK